MDRPEEKDARPHPWDRRSGGDLQAPTTTTLDTALMSMPAAKNEPDKGRRPHTERTAEWVRQHPGLTAALAGGVVLLAFAVYFGSWLWIGPGRDPNGRDRYLEQLRAAKRPQALDRALLAAWIGDAEGAETGIGELESLGSGPSELRMVRAALALGKGDPATAISHLELAAHEHRQSVAIRALLAVAYLRAGKWDRYQATLNDMQNPQPTQPEDFLFKGYALAQADPVRGMKDLDEAVQHRDFPFLRAVRATVRIERALDTGATHDVGLALEDALAAKGQSNNHPLSLAVDVAACLMAAAAFDASAEDGMEARAREARDQAGRDILMLEASPPLPGALRPRWLYLRRTGRESEVLALLRTGFEHNKDAKSAETLALWLHQRGEVDEALKALAPVNAGNDLASDMLRAYLLAESSPDGPAKAGKAYLEIAARFPTEYGPVTAQTILRLLGRKTEAIAVCRQLAEHPDAVPGLAGNDFLIRLLEYNRGELAVADLLRASNGARQQCLAHYHVALTHLADGDRDAARRHFRACQETHYFIAPEYEWARTFFARLQANPKWPAWIPEKK